MISVILPTKNEPLAYDLIEEIAKIMKGLKRPYEIIAIDDSDDDTFLNLKKSKAKVIKQTSKGLGGAIIEGFNNANGTSLITMDADFSHRPKYIPELIDESEKGFDIVIGSRREPGGKIIGWNFTRKIISTGANFVARYIAGIKVSDVTTGYRLYKKDAINNLCLNELKAKNYSFQLEILARAARKNLKIGAIPIVFYDRKRGKSKLSKKEIFSFLMTAFRIRLT
jgi:dolichol-phosphate mannosyltransferase